VSALLFNQAKGRFTYYALLPAANDAIVWAIFQKPTDPNATWNQDAVLQDFDSLADIVANGAVEATFTGYARVAQTTVTSGPPDDTDNSWSVDSPDVVWSPRSAQNIVRIACFYDPDTTTGTDSDLIPLFADDFVMTTPTSGTITYVVNALGWGKAQ